MSDNKIRLQKFLSEAGIASRRKAEEMIRSGLVKVNGKIANIGDSVDPKTDSVSVGGKKVKKENSLRYILLNKPRGYVTTTDDDLGRKCVLELVSGVKERIYPVGRLDRISEGALILTNDGEFANAMMHPSKHVPKTYRVTVRPGITSEQVDILSTGVDIDGRMTAPADVRVLSKEDGRAVLEIVLYEGRNRQIRRMCEALELEVARLKRTAVGSVKLGMLKTGEWRDLTPQEVESLLKSAGLRNGGGAK
ncbi:MAG: pseudouridine synthase [Oscillospiraceae bacterium]|nr:pseudouridine synthase [Clostridiaceae bacterium]MDY5947858.1 pseudouridine synthase [Oscillospiraceae bacterium]